MNPLQRLSLGLISLGAIGGMVSCGNQGEPKNNEANTANAPKAVNLTLVSYAVTQSAYDKIIPKFVEQWQQKTGQTVTFDQSYGGSGSQTRAVIDGLEADVVALALGSDVEKIAKAGLIDEGWEKETPNNGIVTRSVVALVTRDGGPKITTWKDLVQPNLKVITANPKTSGGARWNFLGLWGSVSTQGSDPAAEKFVTEVYKNVPILPKDAREATDVFYKQKQGDVLVNYENEVLLAAQKGEKQPYTVPTDVNISIDAPVAVVDAVAKKKGTQEVAEAFVQYLFTPEAQRIFAENGFRPVVPEVEKAFSTQFPPVKKLLTVEDFGGWSKVQKEFFEDDAVFDRILAAAKK